MPRRRRRDRSFIEWALRGLVGRVLALAVALIAGYLIYLTVQQAFAEAARDLLGS